MCQDKSIHGSEHLKSMALVTSKFDRHLGLGFVWAHKRLCYFEEADIFHLFRFVHAFGNFEIFRFRTHKKPSISAKFNHKNSQNSLD
ncbi:hypothetical protein QVD17_39302 [Tagetes erecta]|uniref:Uncharacterized protein n=1 Tax=Tagetes erecta TaxID=13708 RepID=A0AAD8JTS6_TARER|nr:hypothetical protein QVD17_39302 [Tagetes erecta]